MSEAHTSVEADLIRYRRALVRARALGFDNYAEAIKCVIKLMERIVEMDNEFTSIKEPEDLLRGAK